MSIPKEYLNSTWDFGFSAVDDPDSFAPPEPQAPVVNTEEISGPILERLTGVENSVAEIKSILERLEQASTPNLDTDEYKGLIEKDVKERLSRVEGMVMPLLMNLLKDADTKEYIKWPNRRPTIEAFMDKLLSITRYQ